MRWSLYDQMKLESSLELMLHMVSLLRITSQPDQYQSAAIAASNKLSMTGTNVSRSLHLPLLLYAFNQYASTSYKFSVYNEKYPSFHLQTHLAAPNRHLDNMLSEEEKTSDNRQRWLNSSAFASYQMGQDQLASSFHKASSTGSGNIGAGSISLPEYLQIKTNMIAENLLVILYYLVLSQQIQLEGTLEDDKNQLFLSFFSITELFSTHSFIRIVSRWIRDLLFQE